MKQDEEHLKLLSVFHYVVGGILALFSCFPIIHLIMGLVLVFVPQAMEDSGDAPPAFIGWFFVAIAAAIIFTGWIVAAAILFAGRCLAKRKHYMFCLVVAGVECMFMPLGTVLGVFTIVVLMRESVKELFADATQLNAPTNPDANC